MVKTDESQNIVGLETGKTMSKMILGKPLHLEKSETLVGVEWLE